MTTPEPITPELERVAKAICEQREGTCERTGFNGRPIWRDYIDDGRAALQALLPVGEGMVEAMRAEIRFDDDIGGNGPNAPCERDDCHAAFAAAISHILGEKGMSNGLG